MSPGRDIRSSWDADNADEQSARDVKEQREPSPVLIECHAGDQAAGICSERGQQLLDSRDA
jgi:hypothetical protein